MSSCDCSPKRFLLMAYGNPGRRDDGLGYALAENLSGQYPGLEALWRYQPAIEDAAEMAAYETVVFADATRTGEAPFSFGALMPAVAAADAFTSHAVTPAAVLYLARACFHSTAKVYLLAIRGYEFDEFSESLSAEAAENLRCATAFLRTWLENVGATAETAKLTAISLALAGKDPI